MDKLAGDRAAGRALHPGPAARQPAAALLRRCWTGSRATPTARPACSTRLLGKRRRRRLQRAQPRPGARRCSREPDMKRLDAFNADGIYVLPETVSELPPVGGILTAGAGNPLSHVQLLARNLGIPNVAIDEALLPDAAPPRRQAHRAGGEPRRPGGARRGRPGVGRGRSAEDEGEPERRDVRGRPAASSTSRGATWSTSTSCAPTIRAASSAPRRPRSASCARASRTRWCRASAFPSACTAQVVMDRPYKNTGKTFYEWMVERFRELEALPAGSPEAAKASEALRAEIYDHHPQHRSRPALPRAAARGDGQGVRRRLQGRRVRAHPTPTSRTCPASPARASTSPCPTWSASTTS